MGGLSELAKKTYIKELGGEEYIFTELSIGDHIEIEKRYESFDGDLLSLVQDPQTPTIEALSLVLFLMLQHEYEDISQEHVRSIPARLLPEIYRDVVSGIYGVEGDAGNPPEGSTELTGNS